MKSHDDPMKSLGIVDGSQAAKVPKGISPGLHRYGVATNIHQALHEAADFDTWRCFSEEKLGKNGHISAIYKAYKKAYIRGYNPQNRAKNMVQYIPPF